MRLTNRKAQQTMSMPFGMIFSILLIIVFVVAAFMAVRFFLDIGGSSKTGLFYEDLQNSVNDAWREQSSSFSFDIDLPGDIEMVCFANLTEPRTGPYAELYSDFRYYKNEDVNVFLYPPANAEELARNRIEHINLAEIISVENPHCVSATGELRIKKDFYGKLVIIE